MQQQQPPSQQLQQSQLQQSHPPPSAAQLARLADKKKEFEAVDALQRASALFLRRLEDLADDCEAMAEAGIGARPHPLFYHHSPFADLFQRSAVANGAYLFDMNFFWGGGRAWPGTRAVAADVPHPGYVWCVSFFFFAFFCVLSSAAFFVPLLGCRSITLIAQWITWHL